VKRQNSKARNGRNGHDDRLEARASGARRAVPRPSGAAPQENGNGVGRNGVGRFRRTGCTSMSVHVHGYAGARARDPELHDGPPAAARREVQRLAAVLLDWGGDWVYDTYQGRQVAE